MPKDQDKGKNASGLTERQIDVLDEQRLVNEREARPGEFGGMPKPPVETDEPPARPEMQEKTKRSDLHPESSRPPAAEDIEREGS